MEQRCPKCRLINPSTAVQCDCGWNFVTRTPPPVDVRARARTAERYARYGWLFPTIAWASQIALALTLRGVAGTGAVWLLAMVVQFVLIAAGLYCGAKVLAMGRSALTPGQWRAGIAGVALSGGTILLIAGLAVASLR